MRICKSVTLSFLTLLPLLLLHNLALSEAATISAMNATSGPTSSISVSASVTIPVANQTMKSNEATLRSALTGFLNSGQNVLKTSDALQVNTKTKITNQLNNATQSVEGIEATNAIVGVEVGKAIRTAIASNQQDASALVTIAILSNCKPSSSNIIFCDNTVSIK